MRSKYLFSFWALVVLIVALHMHPTFQKILAALRWIEKISSAAPSLTAGVGKALQDQTRAKHNTAQAESQQQAREQQTTAILDAIEGIRNAYTSEQNKQQTFNNRMLLVQIFTLVFLAVYATVAVFQWCEMRKAANTSSRALRQSTESFMLDERTWVEIVPIQAEFLAPPSAHVPRAAYRYKIYFKNVGKTVASDVSVKAQTSGAGEESGRSHSEMQNWQDNYLLNKFKEMGTGKPVVVPTNPVPRVIAPNSQAPVPFVLTGQEPQIFKTGTAIYDYDALITPTRSIFSTG